MRSERPRAAASTTGRANRLALSLAPLLLALGCQSAPTAVIVKVSADSDVTGVFQLEATLSNAETSDLKTFPETKGDELTFETAFSLTLPGGRTGALDVALTGVASGGALVAHGEGSIELDPGHTVTLPILLHKGPSFCGDGVVDGDEQCDDGNRITDGTCDFRCRLRTGCVTEELLANGDFEQGNVRWTASPPARPLIVRDDELAALAAQSIQAVTPPNVAWLGYDLINTTVTLTQAITLPPGTIEVTASGYYQVRTEEGGGVYDFGYVDLTIGGAPMSPVAMWSNEDAADAWAFFTETFPVTNPTSQNGSFRLRAVMDDDVATTFFFDSVSLTATHCP